MTSLGKQEPMLLRKLGDDDVPACIALARTAGWNTDAARWRMMFAVGEPLGIESDGGELVGTVIVNRFGALATLAMMLVDTAHRRHGLGQRLMEHALKQTGAATVCLYASELGRPLYERFNFIAVTESVRLEGRASPAPTATHGEARPVRAADLPAVCALDEEAQGAPRHRLIEALYAASDRAFLIERDGGPTSFGFASLHAGIRLLGPLVARTDEDACALASALTTGGAEPLRIEVQPGERALLAWGKAAGLAVAAATPLMTLHAAPLPGRRGFIRALAGRAFG
jgi:predicted N-acetyltransferase YhbS